MFNNCTNLTELNLSNFNMDNVNHTDDMFEYCNALHTLRLDNCSNDTISKIISSKGFPTNEIEGITRKIYVNPSNIDNLTPPDNWVFVNCETNEVIN
jgi:surface protein